MAHAWIWFSLKTGITRTFLWPGPWISVERRTLSTKFCHKKTYLLENTSGMRADSWCSEAKVLNGWRFAEILNEHLFSYFKLKKFNLLTKYALMFRLKQRNTNQVRLINGQSSVAFHNVMGKFHWILARMKVNSRMWTMDPLCSVTIMGPPYHPLFLLQSLCR